MKNIVFAVLLLVLLCGCPPKPVHVPIAERVAAETPEDAAARERAQRARDAGIQEEDLLRREAERKRLAEEAARSQSAAFKDILFEFDSYALKPDQVPTVQEIAAYLERYKGVRVVVEGHCDERGTTEYNLALGQKRADAVRDQLVKLGVAGSRIRSLSYGSEMPADPGHTEESWAKNRRAHVKVEQ
jgi:peptidoglycan-associated lipoprotein